MAIFDKAVLRALVTILAFGLVLGFIILAWRTLLMFLFAMLFAYLLEPLVAGLQRRFRWTRGVAVAALYGFLLGGLGIFFIFMSPRLARQASRLTQSAPALTRELTNGQIAQKVGSERGWSRATQLRVRALLVNHRQWIEAAESNAVGEFGVLAGYAVWIGIVPILAVFFLLSGRRFADAFVDQLSRRRNQQVVRGLLSDLHLVLAAYIRAQILLTGIAWLVYLGGFELLRLPYAIALASAAGILEFIPVVGPLTGAILVLGTAFLLDYSHLLLLLIFLGVWRVVQDYVNSPRIMGGRIALHPLAVLFGVLAGAEIGGVIGVYLSVPALAILRVIWRRWRAIEAARPIETPRIEPAA